MFAFLCLWCKKFTVFFRNKLFSLNETSCNENQYIHPFFQRLLSRKTVRFIWRCSDDIETNFVERSQQKSLTSFGFQIKNQEEKDENEDSMLEWRRSPISLWSPSLSFQHSPRKKNLITMNFLVASVRPSAIGKRVVEPQNRNVWLGI